jgi:succinate-acetate transporter protein
MQIFWKGTNLPLGRVSLAGAGLCIMSAVAVATTESRWAFASVVVGFVVLFIGLAIDRGENLKRLAVFAGTLVAFSAGLLLAARLLSERLLAG